VSGVRGLLTSLTAVALLSLWACGPSDAGGDGDAEVDAEILPCIEGETQCNPTGTVVLLCQEDGQWADQAVCLGETPYCFDGACVACVPQELFCEGDNVMQCSADGSGATVAETCSSLETCHLGGCADQCEIMAQGNSNVGCHFWPTPANNAYLDPVFDSDFAVVVHNANDQVVAVQITKGAQLITDRNVQAGAVEVIKLDFDPLLKGSPEDFSSVLASPGGYHLSATLPVTVYQFNPLSFELPESCDNSAEDPCHSYSNDASLLLPDHALSNNYVVVSRPTSGVTKNTGPDGPFHFIPGFASIIGTEEETTVTVHFSSYTAAGVDLQSYRPGDTAQFVLGRADVLQILSDTPADCSGGTVTSDDCNSGGTGDVCRYCDMGPLYDLTGTVIESTAPVAVFAGHACAYVPYNNWACDHLEEQMIPSETWGTDYIVARTEPQSPDTAEPNVVRIISRENDNTIDFDPPGVHASVNLSANEYIEFSSTENFRVSGSKPIMVAQYLVGQNSYTHERDYWGDPAFALVVPFEQYRSEYSFLVPETITYNYVNVIGPVGESGANIHNIRLDGELVEFTDGIVGNYGIARVDLSSSVNSYHDITGDQPFGIMVYGFARFTSYFYPGGLNLEYINPVN
jgi:IgGFc binding protein